MTADIIGAVIAAAIGFLIAFINYTFSKRMLLKAPEKYSGSFVIRQILQVAYLVLVYFVGSKTQIADLTFLLVGAVAGMTIPMFFFTKKLLSVNDAIKTNKTKKEDETDG
ncbi:MAG: hypothetical protein IKB88_05105 [Clostridia bacterium]|nr:hypothetical protein [Clostridia bacterium]